MTEVTKEFIQKNEDEKIIEIEIERLRSFKNHPFQVKDDNEMHLLDDELISFNPAVEISALKKEEQKQLLEAMDYAQAVPSLSQAQRIKKLSKENQLTLEKMQEIMSEIKKGEITRVAFTNEQLHKYFPSRYTPAMMKREIIALLKIWQNENWEK